MSEKKEIEKNGNGTGEKNSSDGQKKTEKSSQNTHSGEVKIIAGHNDAGW